MSIRDSLHEVNCSQYKADFKYNQLPFTPNNKVKLLDPMEKLNSPLKPIQYDLSTLSKLKNDIYVPFGLLHRHKEVVQTNPHNEIPETKSTDIFFENKLKIRKVRPRVYILPQIALDDIDENVMYKGEKPLSDYIYSSDWKDASKFCAKNSFLNQPNSNEIKLGRKDILDKSLERTRIKSKSDIPNIAIEWKKHAKVWEKKQPKDWIDITEMFWNSNKSLGLCTVCDPTSVNLTTNHRKEIDKCTKTDSFRLAYKLMHSSYTGYQPRCPVGVSYSKKIFKMYDPYVTTLMEMQRDYKI